MGCRPTGDKYSRLGLFITAADMAKIDQLYLNRGAWNEKQLISAEWIEASTSQHSRWDQLLYGYLWWIIGEKEHSYAALGDGENAIYVNPAKNLIVAITSFFKPVVKDRIELIKEYIEPIYKD